MEYRTSDPWVIAVSVLRPRRDAATTPIHEPISAERIVADPTSSNVFGIASAISVSTGRPLA